MATTYTNGIWLVRAGEETQFESAWADFVRSAAGRDGANVFSLVRDVDDPRRYMSFAQWDSFDAQRDWKATPEFGEGMARVRQHVEEFTPSVFELVTEVESAT